MTDPSWAKQEAVKIITRVGGVINAENIDWVAERLVELLDEKDRIAGESVS